MAAVRAAQINAVSLDEIVSRKTLCLPSFKADSVLHAGDDGFEDTVKQYFSTPESNAAERLVALKQKLTSCDTQEFWKVLMEEICDTMGAQCGFVAKRILVDEENAAVEMPPLGAPGSCLMGVAFYLNNGKDVNQLHRDYRYHAYGSPCAHMKHDKVFIIPERMTEVIPTNPNQLPWHQSEAFIGVPLMSDGKCYAHFGMIWSSEGASTRKLGWGFIEMFCHALEDLIQQRLVEGRGFAKQPEPDSAASRIIPLSAITASQSLKPYARSLSHELRTPMQGVIGLLDVMHYTVLDAISSQHNSGVREIFQDLKDSIEQVQDSSRRAVDAADNVVHAYDHNMEMPDTPLASDSDKPGRKSNSDARKQTTLGNDQFPSNNKRARDEPVDYHPGPPLKKITSMARRDARQPNLGQVTDDASLAVSAPVSTTTSATTTINVGGELTSTHKHLATLDFLHGVVAEALLSSHPTKMLVTRTELEEIIDVTIKGPKNELESTHIVLRIDANVPPTIVTEEQHLQFSLQKVVDNAIKFTRNGTVTVTVSLSRDQDLIEFRVADTGCGVSDLSKEHIFKPHFQEDNSIARRKDGLGLSLFNAKAHVRKDLGGDMTLERSSTDGPSRGSEFLIRIPLAASPDLLRPMIPLVGTPMLGSRPSGPSSPTGDPYHIDPLTTPRSAPSAQTSPVLPLRRRKSIKEGYNRELAKEIPLNFLVAEDNVINRNLLVIFLKKLGYAASSITIAEDGLEAVARYKENLLGLPERRINCVLMDLWMPNMDGYEASEKIFELAHREQAGAVQMKRDGHAKDLVIIAVTADITSQSLDKADRTGMQGVLLKPYKVVDIERVIMEHFGS